MQKYKLPPTHPLFLDQTFADLAQERYEDIYDEIAGLEYRLEKDPVGSEVKDLQERLRILREAVGEPTPVAQDDLIDLWEEELAAGRMPDLDMSPTALRQQKG